LNEESNAIAMAKTPCGDQMQKDYPIDLLDCSGYPVKLLDVQMGSF
jgi:2,3-bisphosphoglycerate-independent phosphoglycerate mutase